MTLRLRPSLPGHTLVVYDPDSAQVCGIVACEDAYESERVGALALIERAQAGRAWIGERHFCTQAILQGLHERAAGFIARSHVATDPGTQNGRQKTLKGVVLKAALVVMGRGTSDDEVGLGEGSRTLSGVAPKARAQQIEAKNNRFPLDARFFASSIVPSSGAAGFRWRYFSFPKRTVRHGNC